MSATEETSVSGQRAWVNGRKHLMIFVGNKGHFCFCGASPKDKHHWLFSLIKKRYNFIGKNFPSHISVTVCHSLANGKYGVQKQHAVFCPIGQLARPGNFNSQIVVKFRKNVFL